LIDLNKFPSPFFARAGDSRRRTGLRSHSRRGQRRQHQGRRTDYSRTYRPGSPLLPFVNHMYFEPGKSNLATFDINQF
jgi:hypothetical protein